MSSIITAVSDFISSIFEVIFSVIGTAGNFVLSIFHAAFSAVATVFNTAVAAIKDVFGLAEGLVKLILGKVVPFTTEASGTNACFMTGNIFLILLLAGAFFAYTVYQQRQGKLKST